MLNLSVNANTKKSVESEIVEILGKEDCTLNTVNNYGENLLHISAANGCFEITKKILERKESRHLINRKNKFGWTPLMQAIRNGDINIVKLLLENKSNVNESTYLGMSLIGLAAAISKEMFETVYAACPTALMHAANDDINPLCIAAIKNDKELFFRLVSLGLDVSKANEYTHIMMRQSTVTEIAKLAKPHFDVEDYWNNVSDNIDVRDLSYSDKDKSGHPVSNEQRNVECVVQIIQNFRNNNDNKAINKSYKSNLQPIILVDHLLENKEIVISGDSPQTLHPNLLSACINTEQQSLISPTLAYCRDGGFPASPSIYSIQNSATTMPNIFFSDNVDNMYETENAPSLKCSIMEQKEQKSSPQVLLRLQSVRPPDLDISNTREDPNVTLGFMPDFSPTKPAHVPSDINDENVFGENTPTPPRYKTPPRGMVLSTQQTKMILLLEHYGLSRHAPIFIEQEVDMDLFVTLTDNDLQEIGIKRKGDRKALLAMIKEYKKTEMY